MNCLTSFVGLFLFRQALAPISFAIAADMCELSDNGAKLNIHLDEVQDSTDCTQKYGEHADEETEDVSMGEHVSYNGTYSCVNLHDPDVFVMSYEHSGKCFPFEDPSVELVSLIYDIEVQYKEASGERFEAISFIIPLHEHLVRSCPSHITFPDTLSCNFYNFSSSSWSRDGCNATDTKRMLRSNVEATGVLCECSHLSTFAILQDSRIADDHCKIGSVLGNPLWVVFSVLYSLLFLIATFQVRDIHVNHVKDIKFLVHGLIFMDCALNVVISAALHAERRNDVQILAEIAVLWALLYTVTFTTLVVCSITWLNILFNDTGEKPHSQAKSALVLMGISLCGFLLFMFGIIIFTEENHRDQLLLIGSAVIICICVVFCFVSSFTGLALHIKIHKIHNAFAPDEHDWITPVLSKLSAIIAALTFIFVVKSCMYAVFVVDSDIFFEGFSAFQSVLMALDLTLLTTELTFFHTAVRGEVRVRSDTGASIFGRPRQPHGRPSRSSRSYRMDMATTNTESQIELGVVKETIPECQET